MPTSPISQTPPSFADAPELSPEEAAELEGIPLSGILRVVRWGVLLLALVTAFTWFYHHQENARERYTQALAQFTEITRTAALGTPPRLVEMTEQWASTLAESRTLYAQGSDRRATLEVGGAESGLALATALTEGIHRPAAADPVERVRMARALQQVASDRVVRAATHLNPAEVRVVLQGAYDAGASAVVALQRSGAAEDVRQAADIAHELSLVGPGPERRTYQQLADSLTDEARRLAVVNGDDAVGIRQREQMASGIREYLAGQGVSVTAVTTGGRGARILVVRGLGTSESVAGVIINSPAARTRLNEAGFVTLRAHGTTAPVAWSLATGRREAVPDESEAGTP